MNYDREKFEKLILESPVFTLDRETQYAAFKRESYRLIEYLYCYLLSIKKREYEPYGCEITELAARCIRNYDSSKGSFLHYFNAAWKREYSHILADQIREETCRGIHITEEDQRAVRKYLQLVERYRKNSSSKELYQKLSEAMELPVERIADLAVLSEIRVHGDSYEDDEGETNTWWESFSDSVPVDQRIESVESIGEILQNIEEAFQSLQMRQKPIVSDLMTIRICMILEDEQLKLFTEKYFFINSDMVKGWLKDRTLPTQREIAEKHSRSEASVSRTIRDFIKKNKRT